MRNKVLFTLIMLFIFIVLLFVQIYIIDGKTLFGAKPNLILISVIVFTSFAGLYNGTIYSFIVGTIMDFIYGSDFGIFLTSYVIVAIIIGAIEKNYRKQNKNTLIIITFIGTSIFEVICCIIYSILCQKVPNIFSLLGQLIISSLLNMVIVFVLNGIVQKIAEYFEIKSRKKDIL